MSLHLLRNQDKLNIAPSCVSRRYFKQQQRVPLNRREVIKRIAESSLGKTIAKSSCFLIPPEPQSFKKLSVYKSPETSRTERLNLKFGEFKASDVRCLDTIKKSLAKKKFRLSTEHKPKEDTNKDINIIKSMIDRIVVTNRNKHRISRKNTEPDCRTMEAQDPQQVQVSPRNLKATQQYYSIKKYYEEKYNSC